MSFVSAFLMAVAAFVVLLEVSILVIVKYNYIRFYSLSFIALSIAFPNYDLKAYFGCDKENST